jgi:hypothetical protein
MAERTRITVETERILIIARQRAARQWCATCGAEAEFLPSFEARRVLDAATESPAEMQRKGFHLVGKSGGLAVCLRSLLRFLEG